MTAGDGWDPGYEVDIHGRMRTKPDTRGMTSPVRCNHCGTVYDLGVATIISRHADATVFTTPCCNRTADDRWWKSLPDYTALR